MQQTKELFFQSRKHPLLDAFMMCSHKRYSSKSFAEQHKITFSFISNKYNYAFKKVLLLSFCPLNITNTFTVYNIYAYTIYKRCSPTQTLNYFKIRSPKCKMNACVSNQIGQIRAKIKYNS